MLIWNQQQENPFVCQQSLSSSRIPNAPLVKPISSLVCKSCSLVASALRGNYIEMVPRTSMCFCSFPKGKRLKIHVYSILEGSIAISKRQRIRSRRFNTYWKVINKIYFNPKTNSNPNPRGPWTYWLWRSPYGDHRSQDKWYIWWWTIRLLYSK